MDVAADIPSQQPYHSHSRNCVQIPRRQYSGFESVRGTVRTTRLQQNTVPLAVTHERAQPHTVIAVLHRYTPLARNSITM
jgi:hypothetical protein